MRIWRSSSGSAPTAPEPAPMSMRPSGCTSRSRTSCAKVRKKQPAWPKDIAGWRKLWRARKPNANVMRKPNANVIMPRSEPSGTLRPGLAAQNPGFQVDEKRRKVAQIETMIAEFERMGGDLEREIKVEQDRAGIHDPGHFAYPTYAKAAISRRENLKRSADELRIQLDDAKSALGEAFDELKKVELLDERDQMREREAEEAAEQAELDGIALLRMRGAAPA